MSGFAIEDRFLVRNIMRDSQTRMNRVSRFENMQGVFNINLEIFSELEQSRLNRLNPSILLLIVDDIVTTGATIETCYRAIANNLKVKIGVCSLGLTNK